jgi:hypothetical protein
MSRPEFSSACQRVPLPEEDDKIMIHPNFSQKKGEIPFHMIFGSGSEKISDFFASTSKNHVKRDFSFTKACEKDISLLIKISE